MRAARHPVGYRARSANRSGSMIITVVLPCSRIQPRCTKSLSALLTASREDPTDAGDGRYGSFVVRPATTSRWHYWTPMTGRP